MPGLVATRVDDAILTYLFSNTRPIELLDLTSSLFAIGEQYRSFIRRQGESLSEDDYRLYVREVRTGSIIVDLVSQAAQPQVLVPTITEARHVLVVGLSLCQSHYQAGTVSHVSMIAGTRSTSPSYSQHGRDSLVSMVQTTGIA